MPDADFLDLLDDLPDDPRAGLAELCDRISSYFSIGSRLENDIEYNRAARIIELYVDKYKLFVYGPRQEHETWKDQLDYLLERTGSFRFEVTTQYFEEAVATKLEEGSVRPGSYGYAFLKPDEKLRIHQLLSKIRKTIEESQVDSRKKNQIFRRISALASAIDETGTKTDHFIAFLLDMSLVARQIHKDNKALVADAKEIASIMYQRRAADEGIQLPRQEITNLLEGPSEEEST